MIDKTFFRASEAIKPSKFYKEVHNTAFFNRFVQVYAHVSIVQFHHHLCTVVGIRNSLGVELFKNPPPESLTVSSADEIFSLLFFEKVHRTHHFQNRSWPSDIFGRPLHRSS